MQIKFYTYSVLKKEFVGIFSLFCCLLFATVAKAQLVPYSNVTITALRTTHNFQCGTDGFFSNPEPRWRVRARTNFTGSAYTTITTLNPGTVSCGTSNWNTAIGTFSNVCAPNMLVEVQSWEDDGCGGNDNTYSTGCANNDENENTTIFTINYQNAAAGTTTAYTFTQSNGYTITFNVTWSVGNVAPIPTASNVSICNGQTAVLTATNTPISGNNFAWYTDAALTNLALSGNPYSPSPTTTTNYWVVETNGICRGTARQVTVTVLPTPTASISGTTTICQGSSTTLTGNGGASYNWNTTQAGASISVSPSSNQTYTVTATGSNGCTASSATLVTVLPVPTTGDYALCQNGTVGAGQGLTATLSTVEWYTAASGGSAIGTGSPFNPVGVAGSGIANTATASSTTFYAGYAGNPCRNPAVFTINPTPLAPTASGVTICSGNTATLTASVTAASVEWYAAASGGSALSTGTSFTTPILTANTTYYVEGRNGVCESPRTAVTVTVNPIPTSITAADQTICASTTATLNAIGATGTVRWYNAASGGTLLGSGSPFTTNTLNSNTIIFIEQTIAGCASSRNPVNILVNPIPANPTGTGATVCNGQTAAISASGANVQWYNVATGGTAIGSSNTFTTPALTANKTYYATQTVSGCTSLREPVLVTVNPIPAGPTANGVSICNGQTATLNATGSNIQWYSAATGGAALASGSSFTTPALSGNTSYYAEQSVLGCPSTRTAVLVTVNPIPAAPTASGVSICSGTTATLTALGSSIEWYDQSSNGTLLFSGTPYTTGVLTSNTSYYVQQANLGCVSPRTLVVATIKPVPSPPITTNATTCAGQSATLLAQATVNGTLNWFDAAAANVNTGTIYNITTTTAGTFTYTVTETLNGCTSAASTATLTVNALPAAPTAAGATICSGDNTTLTATGTGTISWYDAQTGGNLLSTGAIFNTPNLTATTIYYIEQTSNNCTGARAAVTVTVNANPSNPVLANPSICESTNTVLNASGTGTLTWYADATGTAVLGANPFTTPNLNSSTIYYVGTMSGTGCMSSLTAVTVTVNPTPNAPTLSNTTICSGQTATLTATNTVGTTTWYSDAAATLVTGTASSYTTPTLTSTTTYYVSNTSAANCRSLITPVTVTVNPLPVAPTASGATICSGQMASLSATSSGGTLNWHTGSATGPIVNTGNTYDTPVLTATTTYYVAETQNGCLGTATPVTVTVNQTPTAPTATGISICEGNTATLTATGGTGTVRWYEDGSGVSLAGTGTVLTTQILQQTTTFYLNSTSTAGCASTYSPVTVIVNPLPSEPIAANQTICSGQTATLSVNNPAATVIWSANANGSPQLATGASYTTAALTATTTFYTFNQSAALCNSSIAPVVVTVNTVPTAPTAQPQTICEGETATLTATGTAGTTIYWHIGSATGTIVNAGSTFTTPALTANTTYYITQESAQGCMSAANTVLVTVRATPSTPTASGVSICSGNTAALSASITGTGTIHWYSDATALQQVATGATFTTPNLTQNTTYYVGHRRQGCESVLLPVTVTVNALPSPPSASDATICEGSGTNIVATNASATTVWFNNASGTLPTVNTGVVFSTPVLTTTTTYYLGNVNTQNCRSSLVPVTVTVLTSPAAVTATGATICAGLTATLTASGGTGSIEWRNQSNNVVFTGNVFTTPALGSTTTYYVTETATGCPSPSTSVTVTILPTPNTPTITAPSLVCFGNTATLNAGGSTGTIRWYSDATGSSLLFTGNPYTTNPITQITTFYVNETGSNGCASGFKPVTIGINPLPSAPISANQTICGGTTAILSAQNTSGTTNWYTDAAGTNLAGSGTSFTTPVLNATTTYYVENLTVATGCRSERNAVTVTVTPLPTSPILVQGSLTACLGASGQYVAIVPPPAQTGTINWLANGGPGGPVSIGTGNVVTLASAPQPGMITINIVNTVNGCPSAPTSFTIDVTPPPPPPMAQGVSVCFGEAATLTANAMGQLTWSSDAQGATLVASGNTFTTTPLTQTTTYYVFETSPSGCKSNGKAVTVNVNALPSAPVCANQIICAGTAATLTATNALNAVWFNSANTQLFAGASYTTPTLQTTRTYFVQNTDNNTCKSPKVPVVVTVTPVPPIPTVLLPPPTDVCIGDMINGIAQNTGGVISWTLITPFGPFSVTGDVFNLNSATIPLPGSYTVQVTETKNGCTSSPSTSTLNLHGAPQLQGSVMTNAPLCEGKTLTITSGSGTPGVSFAWTGPNNYTSSGANPSIPNVTENANQGVYSLVITDDQFGCKSTPIATYVEVNPSPSNVLALNDSPVCPGGTVHLTANSIPGATYEWLSPTNDTLRTRNVTLPNVTAAGTYTMIVSLAGCGSTPITTQVDLYSVPLANAGADKTVRYGESAILQASGGFLYQWSPALDVINPNGATTQTATNVAIGTHTYTVQVVSANGCSATDEVIVTTTAEVADGSFNDLITPNNDGINDYWHIPFVEGLTDGYTLKIYARAGTEVYSTSAYDQLWNGTMDGATLPDGTYWYIIVAKNGKTYKGAITVKR